MPVLILERLRERKREKGCFSRYYLSAKLQMMNYDLSAFVSPTQRYHHYVASNDDDWTKNFQGAVRKSSVTRLSDGFFSFDNL